MSGEAFILAFYFGLGVLPALGILLVPKARTRMFSEFAWYGIGKTEATVVIITLCTLFGVPMLFYATLHRPTEQELAQVKEWQQR